MKKILLLFALIFFAFHGQSQIVTIPDANFKQGLLDQFDTNTNGEIEVSEALAVTELVVDSDQITNLTGLEAFQNLTNLQISYVQTVDLNISTLVNLTQLIVYEIANPNLDFTTLTNLQILVTNNCSLTSLDVSTLSQLITLQCYGNNITNITLPTNNNIQNYFCASNQLTAIDLTDFTHLKSLNCGNNPLTSLTISNNNTLELVSCSNLALTTIGFQNLPSLRRITCSDAGITSIDLSQIPSIQELTITNTPLTNLNLINLPNLATLNCNDNQLSNLDLNNLPNLLNLNCVNNPISNLNLLQVPNLKQLVCNNTAITSFDFSASANLEFLSCVDSPLTVIDFNGLTNLKDLRFGNDTLSQVLNLSALVNLNYISINKTTLQTIDVSPIQQLKRLGVYFTPFVTLDFSNNPKIVEIQIENNANLEYLNSNNGRILSRLVTGPYWIKYCPNLTRICATPIMVSSFNIVMTHPGFFNNIANPLILPYCSFAPSGDHNTITGAMTLDMDNNGCDANDLLVKNAKVTMVNGSNQYETLTNAAGVFNFYPIQGTYTIAPNLGNNYFNITPNSASITFANELNNTATQNFCLSANGIKNDLNIVMVPLDNARPGFSSRYNLVYKNTGNQTLSGTINLSFNDDLEDYLANFNPVQMQPDSSSLNNLNWNFSNLLPFESRTITVRILVHSATDVSPANAGDLLNYTATISSSQTDETPSDNIFNLTQTVVSSYDPNDKICLEGTTITPDKVGDYLHYVIRFQNTGTASAENVVVKDIIDTTKFDMNSLQFTDSSHPMETRITNNAAEFIFEGINLPTQTADELASQGFVAFKVKTKSTLALGNTVENKADIYFDFNFPVVTNTTSTTVALLNINDFEANSVSMSPIPVKDMLQINALENITSVALFDIQGRLLQSIVTDTTTTSLDFSGKSAGIYLVKVYTANGSKTQKVIKK